MLNLKTLITGVALAAASIGAFAQAASAVTPRVDQREANQQARIDKGVASGALTAHETNRLDKQQARVASADTAAKADGRVTAKERAHLHRMQNHGSREIHALKHNTRSAPKG